MGKKKSCLLWILFINIRASNFNDWLEWNCIDMSVQLSLAYSKKDVHGVRVVYMKRNNARNVIRIMAREKEDIENHKLRNKNVQAAIGKLNQDIMWKNNLKGHNKMITQVYQEQMPVEVK